MDRASQVLSDCLPGSRPCTYRGLATQGAVAYATMWHRAHGRRSIQDKAKSQQCLTPAEEKALAQYLNLKRSANPGYPVLLKYLRSMAFSIRRRRSPADSVDADLKLPDKNCPKAFEEKHQCSSQERSKR
ncbi:hypothetical protein IFM58399_09494 [Aspergillus lentulus]|uniref:uncharacterized protein n=1 Tax=Aspergillus lentulus TaxID=293939 RepID=UPI0013948CC0|nr:uncharacterized protein IFM58399_09494 [Aspergillus lentulus]GFF53131.1 hypothetical protein IFM58399_09494 [Aspergillus lentulus]GFF96655.1 hypothetical protein IFM47457_10991 [Aspergillus lentulus]